MLCPSLYEMSGSDPRRRCPRCRELNIHWIRWRFLFTGAELVTIDAIRICHGQVTLARRAFRPVEPQIVALASPIKALFSPNLRFIVVRRHVFQNHRHLKDVVLSTYGAVTRTRLSKLAV